MKLAVGHPEDRFSPDEAYMFMNKVNNVRNGYGITILLGAQWLSGRVLDSRPKGRGFEPHRRHCVVVLEQDTFILA